MDASEKRKHAAFIVSDWLNTAANDKSMDANQTTLLNQAMRNISDVFGVSLSDPKDQAEYAPKPANLTSILDIYLRTKKRTSDGPAKATASSSSSKKVSEEDKKKAEELKAQGNAKLAEKAFDAAIDFYTQAIQLDGTNPIYIANRAAAHSQAGDHEKAVADCDKALAVDPNYSKAYSRKGFSLYSLNRFEESEAAYAKALELDPESASIKKALQQTRVKLGKTDSDVGFSGASAPSNSSSRDGGPAGGGFDPSALGDMFSNNPAMAGLAEQMGGAGGISALMQNPQVRQMAQQMMSDPAAMSNLMNMFGGGAGGGGR